MRSACVAVAFLAFAGSAFAKAPQLLVRGATARAASAATIVELKDEPAGAAPARISIYVPSGYTMNVGQPVGTAIGVAEAQAQLLDLSPNAIADVGGTILVANRDDPSFRANAVQCTGSAAHSAIWTLHVLFGATTLDLPVYVDPTVGAEAAFSSAKLVFCLPNPYAAAAPGTRSPSGTKIFDAKTTLSAGVLTTPPLAGRFVWRVVVTPWTVSGADPNFQGTLETQGIVTVPSTVSLRAKVSTNHHRGRVANSVLLSGRLLENLEGVADAKVAVYGNGRSVAVTTTDAGGAFAKRVFLKRRTTFRATARLPMREVACMSPLGALLTPAGCVSATFASYRISSGSVTVSPRAR